MGRLYERGPKRAADVVVSCLLLLLTSPLWLITTIAVLAGDGRPILFRQRRTGRDGEEFTILKFRTMPRGTPDVESRQASHLRPTRVGAFLRRTNLDELPQLVNIIRGDMSIVGPRPPLPTQADVIDGRRANGSIRLRPGVTGLAQVNGRDDMTDDEKVTYDARYAASVSFGRHLLLIARTIGYVFRRPPRY